MESLPPEACLDPDDEKLCLSYHAEKLQAALRSASRRYKQLTGRTWHQGSPPKQRRGTSAEEKAATARSAHMGEREGQTTSRGEQAGNVGGQSGSKPTGNQGTVVRDAAFERRMAVIRARAAQAIDEEMGVKAALHAKRGEEVAAKKRAQEALDEVRREVEREKKRYEFERWVMAAELDNEKSSQQQTANSKSDKVLKAGLEERSTAVDIGHTPCVCACLTAVLGPHKIHEAKGVNGEVRDREVIDGTSEECSEASAEEDTWSEQEVDTCPSTEVEEADSEPDSAREVKLGRGHQGSVFVRRGERAEERARLERLCLELARLEKRLEEVVGRKRGSLPVATESDNGTHQNFQDKRIIFEGPTQRVRSPASRGSPQHKAETAGGFKRHQRDPLSNAKKDHILRPLYPAVDVPRFGQSISARGAYEAAQMCQQGIRACPYRRAGEPLGADEKRGRSTSACCSDRGSDGGASGRQRVRPQSAYAIKAAGGLGSDEVARLRRHNRALSRQCRDQVCALADVAKKALVAEGLATRAARAAAAASHPPAASCCGPATVCRSAEGRPVSEDLPTRRRVGMSILPEWGPHEWRPSRCISCR